MEKTIQQMQKKEKILTTVINVLFLVLSTAMLTAILSLVSSF
jgi:cell division protein FtsL